MSGGIAAVAVTMSIPKLVRNTSTTTLVLAGVVVGSLMSSVMSIIKVLADTDTQLAEITYWTMGSFSTVTFSDMLPVLPIVIVPAILILVMRFRLNVLSLGDSEARSLGIDLQRTRGVFIICSTLITTGSVCAAGTVGWVGLIIPHISRMVVGSDNKKMLPFTVVLGSVFMLFIDFLCRSLAAAELRLGILTGIVGGALLYFHTCKAE
ncbi:MAG: iron ABC transporter permease [Eubacteriales bacterium]|nr:iron ABC transporter permease [Eubacteriales bacterium]